MTGILTDGQLATMNDHDLGAVYRAAVEAGYASGDMAYAEKVGRFLDARSEAEQVAENNRLEHVAALHNAARFYARCGLPVFPLVPEAKVPLTRTGFKDASTEPAVIDTWWTRNPAANIGVPTGVLFDVLDIDGAQGHRSMTEFAVEVPNLIGRQRTARPGGWHYLVPVGTFGPGNRAGLLPGVDVRGLGGYVVVAPSRVNGARYRWVDVPQFLLPGGAS